VPLAGNVATVAKWGKRGVEAADKLNDVREAEHMAEYAAGARKLIDDAPGRPRDGYCSSAVTRASSRVDRAPAVSATLHDFWAPPVAQG
jgi:hypothetical protein